MCASHSREQRRQAAALFPGAGTLRVFEDAEQEALRGAAGVYFVDGEEDPEDGSRMRKEWIQILCSRPFRLRSAVERIHPCTGDPTTHCTVRSNSLEWIRPGPRPNKNTVRSTARVPAPSPSFLSAF